MDSCANIAVSNLVVTGNVAQEAAGVLYFNTLEDVYSCQCTGCTVSGNKGIGCVVVYCPSLARPAASCLT